MDEMLRDFYTKSEVDNKFGGMVIEKISKEDFDALTTKDPDKIYFVYDDQGKITQYIGDTELSSGTGAANMQSVYQYGLLSGTSGNMEFEQEG